MKQVEPGMLVPPTLPVQVVAALADTFPGRPVTALAPTFGGFSNLSLLANLGGVPCVIKAAQLPTKRIDLHREFQMLTMLRGRRLGAPAPLGFTATDDWSILVTARRRGTPGLRLYDRSPEQLTSPLAALGRTLARLHGAPFRSPAPTPAAGLLLTERLAALRAELTTLPLPTELHDCLTAALDHEAWRAPPLCPVHGDAGLHNILWDGHRLTLLDWELAGWGDPRLDLAWVIWTLRFRGLPASCDQAFLDGYGRERSPLKTLNAAAAALMLGQIAGLLVRAAGRPTWDEWLRRARWTLKLNEQVEGL